MARLSKTKGVELYRFLSPDGTAIVALFSYGARLAKHKNLNGKWAAWKRDGEWPLGEGKRVKADYLAGGWTLLHEFGKD